MSQQKISDNGQYDSCRRLIVVVGAGLVIHIFFF